MVLSSNIVREVTVVYRNTETDTWEFQETVTVIYCKRGCPPPVGEVQRSGGEVRRGGGGWGLDEEGLRCIITRYRSNK